MADVTLSYKGSDILELSDSGSATLKTGGKYCEDDVTVEYVKPSGGGERRASGTFTIASKQLYTLNIVHNLGTPKIAVFVRSLSLVADTGYAPMFIWAINKHAFINEGESWEIDLRPYNSTRYPDVLNIDPSVTAFVTGWVQGTPWTSQSIWDDSTNPGRQRNFVFTETSFSDTDNRWWMPGTFVWTAIALE